VDHARVVDCDLARVRHEPAWGRRGPANDIGLPGGIATDPIALERGSWSTNCGLAMRPVVWGSNGRKLFDNGLAAAACAYLAPSLASPSGAFWLDFEVGG